MIHSSTRWSVQELPCFTYLSANRQPIGIVVMKQIRPKLSLIIPVFNEEKRLAKGIKTLESVTRRMPRRFELIVVDDGSLRPQQAFLPKTSLPIDFFRLFQNRGKGAA